MGISKQNVELTRRAFQAFDDRDLDALLAILDADVEALPILAGMEGGYHGHDGVRRWWATLLGTFPDFHAEILEVHDLGDVTIATLRLRGHGAESDTPLDATAWQVTQFRHGRCIRWRVYMSKAEAPRSRGAAGVA
jgi:ketosteroid isomerase-like protein